MKSEINKLMDFDKVTVVNIQIKQVSVTAFKFFSKKTVMLTFLHNESKDIII